jgi:hypothetical protein
MSHGLDMRVVNESGLNEGAIIAAGDAFTATLDSQTPRPSGVNDDKEIERLRSKGADYTANEADWRFKLRAYEGGPNYVGEDTLFRHAREMRVDFTERMKRAHYQNYCQPLVDFVPEYIFSQDVERSAPQDLKDEYEQFKKDCDRCGTELNSFMQTVGEDMRIFGMVYIQVDKPAVPADVNRDELSVQRAKELGIDAPYLILVRPLEVLDWRTDSKGNFVYMKRVECTTILSNGSWYDVERFTEWRPTTFKVSLIDVSDPKEPKLLQRGVDENNPVGVIPFVPVYFKRLKSNRDIGQSFLQDIAYQNRAVFNQTSLIEEFLYRQCFNLLAMPSKGGVPMKDQVDGHVGTSNVLEIPEGSTLKPEYISPPVDPAEFIQKEREMVVREMYRQAAQDVMSELMRPGRQSGDSAKQNFSRTIPVINKTADSLQYAERRVMELWAKMQSKSWDGGKISYKDDYSITSLLDLLIQLGMIMNDIHLFSPTFIKEEWKRVVREMDGKIAPETLAKIESEIDKLSDEDLKLAMSAGQPGQTGVPTTANMLQGQKQTRLGSDKKIGAASGSKATTKEVLPDANKRARTGTTK